jgi:transcriptional regulator with XRE-family HTH domain
LPLADEGVLGAYLKERRARLDPAAFGLPLTRRRTPGLRREEVAQRANISPTWYSWLEQGRGGAPSADVLDRIARALMLSEIEREHLFLLGRGHPPEARYRGDHAVTPRLQRVLEALEPSPALIRTASYGVVAWNRAVAVMLTDYAALPLRDRNILRGLFLDPRAREVQADWASVARFVVGAFRIDAARAGAAEQVKPLVEELCRLSPEFAALWRDTAIQAHGEGIKTIRHPLLGIVKFEYSGFAVDGRSDLTMIVYHPIDAGVARRIAALVESKTASGDQG